MSSNDNELAVSRELARQLVNFSLDRADHRQALQSLLLAFVSMAAAHPCCTESAADAALRASQSLRSPSPANVLQPSLNLH